MASNSNASNILPEDKVKSRTLIVPTKDHHIPMFPLLQHHPPPSSRGNNSEVRGPSTSTSTSTSSSGDSNNGGNNQKEVETWKQKVKDLEIEKVKLLNHVKQAEESIKSYRGRSFIGTNYYEMWDIGGGGGMHTTVLYTYVRTYIH